MGVPITSTRIPSRIRNPEGDLPFLRGENFSGFFLEPFLGAIIAAAAITTATTTATLTATAITTATLIIIPITATAISGTPIKVKTFPSGKTFQKISASTSL